MNSKQPATVEEYQLESSYARLQQVLATEPYADALEKPLAHWALPADRGLPLAFLGWSLKDLLSKPFGELLATPGVGHRKMTSLIGLLNRATADELAGHVNGNGSLVPTPTFPLADEALDPSNISEAQWEQWRETVRHSDIGSEPLGRMAPTLRTLPTVIWNTPLEFYVDRTLDEIRRMKTHGEKRVRAVLEVYRVVHHALSGGRAQEAVDVRLTPSFIRPLEAWISRAMAEPRKVTLEEVHDSLARGLVEQIRVDIGENVAELARGRLGIDGPAKSVREQASQMGLTRARVYQLLEDCTKVMSVRWPDGQWLLAAVEERLRNDGGHASRSQFIAAIRDVFFHTSAESIPSGVGPHRIQAEPLVVA